MCISTHPPYKHFVLCFASFKAKLEASDLPSVLYRTAAGYSSFYSYWPAHTTPLSLSLSHSLSSPSLIPSSLLPSPPIPFPHSSTKGVSAYLPFSLGYAREDFLDIWINIRSEKAFRNLNRDQKVMVIRLIYEKMEQYIHECNLRNNTVWTKKKNVHRHFFSVK